MNLVEPVVSTKERVESRTEGQTQGQEEGNRAKEAGRERQGKGHRNSSGALRTGSRASEAILWQSLNRFYDK